MVKRFRVQGSGFMVCDYIGPPRTFSAKDMIRPPKVGNSLNHPNIGITVSANKMVSK